MLLGSKGFKVISFGMFKSIVACYAWIGDFGFYTSSNLQFVFLSYKTQRRKFVRRYANVVNTYLGRFAYSSRKINSEFESERALIPVIDC